MNPRALQHTVLIQSRLIVLCRQKSRTQRTNLPENQYDMLQRGFFVADPYISAQRAKEEARARRAFTRLWRLVGSLFFVT